MNFTKEDLRERSKDNNLICVTREGKHSFYNPGEKRFTYGYSSGQITDPYSKDLKFPHNEGADIMKIIAVLTDGKQEVIWERKESESGYFKEDLQRFDKVILRNGNEGYVFEGEICGSRFKNMLNFYTDDLTYFYLNKDLDIVKVVSMKDYKSDEKLVSDDGKLWRVAEYLFKRLGRYYCKPTVDGASYSHWRYMKDTRKSGWYWTRDKCEAINNMNWIPRYYNKVTQTVSSSEGCAHNASDYMFGNKLDQPEVS